MSTPGTIALSYNGYVNQIATLAVENVVTVSGVVQAVDPPFNTMLPQALNYAEQRIQRDLDLSNLEMTDATFYNLTAGSHLLTIDVDDFAVVTTIMANNIPLLPVTRTFIQNVYGPGSTLGQPLYFAPAGGDNATGGNTSTIFLVCPIPDQNYPVTIVGTIWMPSLINFATPSLAATSSTLISRYLPDLLIMASMVYVSGYQRNFGAQSDDAQQAVSYEAQYQALLPSAAEVNYRSKFQASAWSSTSSSPVATPAR